MKPRRNKHLPDNWYCEIIHDNSLQWFLYLQELTFLIPIGRIKGVLNFNLKPGLHIVVRVAEHACDDASKRILKPSTYRLQIFLVTDQYLRSLLPHGDQAIAEQLEKHVLKPMLRSL